MPRGITTDVFHCCRTEPDSRDLFINTVTIDGRSTPPFMRIAEGRPSGPGVEECLKALSCEITSETETEIGGTQIRSEDCSVSVWSDLSGFNGDLK